jgi:hypothetical protein
MGLRRRRWQPYADNCSFPCRMLTPDASQTDARIKRVKEVLGILRMIKQFGWETSVKAQVSEVREMELKWIFRRKMLNVLNVYINHAGA